ncbi:hypothetical protein RSC3_00488 [Bacillus paralicheniformis]|nr:hypothetical protein RSC3_00488 [Bacillus paralicheniformis]
MNKILPVAIIGGGPVGIAAAAHLVKRNEAFILFESGKEIGTNFLDYGHVRLFSPWEYNIDEAAKELLLKHHISLPPKDELPLGEEIVFKYLKPLSQLPEMKPYIHMNSRVLHVGKKGFDKVKTKGRDQAPLSFELKLTTKKRKYMKQKQLLMLQGLGKIQTH